MVNLLIKEKNTNLKHSGGFILLIIKFKINFDQITDLDLWNIIYNESEKKKS